MAVTERNVTSTGATSYTFPFEYLKTTDVKVSVNGTASTEFTVPNGAPTTVQFNTGHVPASGAAIRIYRDTDSDNLSATFYAGSAIKSQDLNDNFNQNLYVTQEAKRDVQSAWQTGDETIVSTETWVSNDTRVATTGAIDPRVDAKIDTAMEGDVLAGTDIAKTASGGQVTINHNVSGANSTVNNSDGTVLQDITITAQGHVTSIGSKNLNDVYYTETELNAGQLNNLYYTETELNAGQLNNLYYTETELNAGQLDTRYYTETELNAGQLDNRYFTETELTGGALDGRYFTETEADARYYRLGSVEEIQSGETWVAADNKIATTQAIDARITDLVDDVGGFVPIANETSFPNANPDVNNGAGTLISIKALSSNLTSNGSGVATIANGTVGNSTVTITGLENSTTYSSTLGMIVETTSTLNTYTFHRITPKATEVTTVASNISNINAVANNASNINSAVSNASNINSAVSNASNINSAVSNASNITTVAGNNTNINTVAGANSNITTVAGSISNVNTVGGSIANVNTVATNISSVNDFAARYRVAGSAPSSSLDVGDLYFDTTGNELKVYNGSAWQGGVTATGNLLSKSGDQMTGNLTFSGSQTVDGRDVSVDGSKLDTIAANANNYDIAADLLDQDDMATNSATKVPSQQSVKAYVDAGDLSLIDEDDMATNSATRPPSQQSVKAYADTKAPLASPALTGTATAVNLTMSGNLTVNGTTTTVATTNTTVTDNLLELNSGAGSNANDAGILIERGSTGDNAIIAWDESADKFIVGTTTATNTATGNLTIAAGTLVTGTIEDSKGNLRSIPQNTQGSTYTLVASDAGKHILASGTITVPDSVFSAGDAVTIVNNTASDLTITKTITTMYMSTDGTSANRTLATRGVATILFASGTVAYISGAGLS